MCGGESGFLREASGIGNLRGFVGMPFWEF